MNDDDDLDYIHDDKEDADDKDDAENDDKKDNDDQ